MLIEHYGSGSKIACPRAELFLVQSWARNGKSLKKNLECQKQNGYRRLAGSKLSMEGHSLLVTLFSCRRTTNLLNCRYGLKEQKRHGEAASADPSTVREEQARQQEILAQYRPQDCFNLDEAGLCGSNPPDRGMATTKLSGTKKSKDRITILFGCNADGSEKLPLLFIGKSERSRCFRNKTGRELGFNYKSNKKAWMTAALFEE